MSILSNSMRQLVAEVPVHPSARNGRQNRGADSQRACAECGEKRAGTSARHRPAEAEQQTAVDLTFAERFVVKLDVLSVDRPDFEFFDQKDGYGAHYHSRAYDTIHMERLQPEHFLYAKPRYDFGLHEGHAEQQTHCGILKIIVPGVGQFRFIDAHGVQRTHFQISLSDGRSIEIILSHDFFQLQQ